MTMTVPFPEHEQLPSPPERLAVTVYSDASVRFGRKHPSFNDRHGHLPAAAGYAVTIIPQSGEPIYDRGFLDTDSSVQAEIDALAIGIALCPPASRLIVYYDLNDLPAILERRVSYSSKLQIDGLLAAAALFQSVEWRRVDPKNPIYRDCHRRAYGMAGRNGNVSGLPVDLVTSGRNRAMGPPAVKGATP